MNKQLGTGFTFYKFFDDATNRLPQNSKAAFMKAIIEYGVSGGKVEPPDSIPQDAMCAFELCKGIIDAEIKENANNSKTKPKKEAIRHKYGLYKNVLLTDEQVEKLKDEFPNDYKDRIEKLSEYVSTSGKKYKNHLAVIRSWARKERQSSKKPKWINDFSNDLPNF